MTDSVCLCNSKRWPNLMKKQPWQEAGMTLWKLLPLQNFKFNLMSFLFWKVIFFTDFHFTSKVMKYIFLWFDHSFHHPIFRNFAYCAGLIISQSNASSWIPKIRSSTNFYSHLMQPNGFAMVCHMHPPEGPYLILHSFRAFQDNLLEMFLPLLSKRSSQI